MTSVLVGAGLSWTGVLLIRMLGYSLPRVGPLTWISWLLLAIGTCWYAFRAYRQIQKQRTFIDPRRAVRWLAWGKTSLLAGAGLAGAWLAFGIAVLPGLPAPYAVERAVHAGIGVFLSISWAVAGWFLERSCRIPPAPKDEDDDSSTLPAA